ncbi:MAG: BON domain-containing protein [Planctomycetes bacterium]|nr:BON domain-containing protein [Planctomycetota bacterium]
MKALQRLLCSIAVICGLIACMPDHAMAQRTTTGGTGSSGFGNLGGSSGGLSGSNSFGGGQNRFSTTNANSAGAGQSVLLNQQSAFGLQGQGQQNGMVGARNTQQFLGANQAGLQNQQQNQNRSRNNRGRQNQGMDPNDFNGMNQQGQDQDSRRAIRPQQRVAFDVPKISYEDLNTTLNSRFDRVTRQPALRGVTVDLDADGVVVLRGEVATPSQKQLAANMVRLEPGVKKVRNELTLAEPPAKP